MNDDEKAGLVSTVWNVDAFTLLLSDICTHLHTFTHTHTTRSHMLSHTYIYLFLKRRECSFFFGAKKGRGFIFILALGREGGSLVGSFLGE